MIFKLEIYVDNLNISLSSIFGFMQKYDVLFERNAKQGSFYLQSKVHRAKEYLEGVYQNKGQGNSG